MNKVVFHSFYSDPGLISLKHCLFYFDKLIIPTSDFLIAFGQNHKNVRHIQLLPENIYDDIEFLRKEGHVEFSRFRGEEKGDPGLIADIICDQLNREGGFSSYLKSDIQPVFDTLRIKPNSREAFEVMFNVVIFMASYCLRELALAKSITCADNRIILDSVNLGLRGIWENQEGKKNIHDSSTKSIMASLLAQKILYFYLPAFEFRSFEDVLELKEKFKEGIWALDTSFKNFSNNIDGLPWEPDFNNKIDELLKKNVIPQVEALKKELKFSKSNFVKKLWDSGKSNISLSFCLFSVWPNLIQEFFLGGSIITFIEALMEEKKRREEIETKNALSILFKVSS